MKNQGRAHFFHPVLLGIVAIAAALRFATLGTQSFWLDETLTANAVAGGLGEVWSSLNEVEASPPLYFWLAWLWSELFGDGDAALRSLSALAGLATVPVAYALGRRAVSSQAGLVAAALVAVSPFMVWYSQEARAYALAGLLTGLALFFYSAARERPEPRALAGWAVASGLALATHYFTAPVVLTLAFLLLRAHRERAVMAAIALACLPGAVLLPLALDQDDLTSWIAKQPFQDRFEGVVKAWVSGPTGAPGRFLGLLGFLLLATGVALGIRAALRRRTDLLFDLLAVGAAATLGVFLLKLVGKDYVFYRYVYFGWLPLAVVTAAGLVSLPRRAGPAVAVAAVALLTAVTVAVSADEDYQRDDWEAVADALGEPEGERLVVVNPSYSYQPLERYGHPLDRPTSPAPVAREVAVVAMAAGWQPPPSVGSLPLVENRQFRTLRLARYRGEHAERLTAADIGGLSLVDVYAALER